MDATAVRVPPSSVAAEQAVLGGVMLAANGLDRLEGTLTEGDFYRQDHRLIFRAIAQLAAQGQPYDAVTLGDWFAANGLVEATGGMAYVARLAADTASAANVLAYARIVRQKADQRRLIDLASQALESAWEADADPQAVADEAICALMATQRSGTNHEISIADGIRAVNRELVAAVERGGPQYGVPSGLTKLDRILLGFHPGDLVVIGARPSQGKTALLLNFADASGVPCGIVSAEQAAMQIFQRMVAIRSGVSAERIRAGDLHDEDWPRLTAAATALHHSTVWIYDRGAPSMVEVQRVARRWASTHGIKALYVDYIQRIRAGDPRSPRHERVGEVAQGLKDIARELGIPVIALAQVSRDVEKRTDKRPLMGDLSDSSEIEKEADQILMLYRDDVYNAESPDRGTAELRIEKNRHGRVGFVRCAWLAESMRFRDLDVSYYADERQAA